MRQQEDGGVARGAARVVAMVGGDGSVSNINVTSDPNSVGAKDTVACLVVFLGRLTFPVGNDVARGFAVETLWGQLPVLPASR
jgi:hypothetical protein